MNAHSQIQRTHIHSTTLPLQTRDATRHIGTELTHLSAVDPQQKQIKGQFQFGVMHIDKADGMRGIWAGSGVKHLLEVGVPMTFVSTSNEDLFDQMSGEPPFSGGTGARFLRVDYLDENFDTQTTNVPLFGTTPFTPPTLMTRIIFVIAIGCGSATHNVGDITITDSVGLTLQTTILATKSIASELYYTIPNGKDAWIRSITFHAGREAALNNKPIVNFKIWVWNRYTKTSACFVEVILDTSVSTTWLFDWNYWPNAIDRSDIYCTAETSENTTFVTCGLHIMERDFI